MKKIQILLTFFCSLTLHADAAINPWSPQHILKSKAKCLNLEKLLDELRKPQLALHLTLAKPLTSPKNASKVSERFKNNLKSLYHAREMTTTDDLMAKGVIPVRAEQGESCKNLKLYLNRAHAKTTCFPGKNENGCNLEQVAFDIEHATPQALEMKNLKNAEIWRIELASFGELKVTRRMGVHQIPHRCDTHPSKPDVRLEKHPVEIEKTILYGSVASQPKGRDLTLDHIVAGDRRYEVELEKDSQLYCESVRKN